MKRFLFVLVFVCVAATGLPAPAGAQPVLPGQSGTTDPSKSQGPPLGRDFMLVFSVLSFALSSGVVLVARRRLA